MTWFLFSAAAITVWGAEGPGAEGPHFPDASEVAGEQQIWSAAQSGAGRSQTSSSRAAAMTTASSSTASGLSVKALVLGGLAIVAVATTATVLWHRSKATAAKSRSPKSKRGLKKAARKTRQAAAVEIPSEEDLVGRIIRSMETMQTSGSVTGSNEVQLERIALAIEPSTLSTRARLLLAQWSILFYTIKTITGEQSGQQAEILRDMHEGMRHAWALLAVQSQCSPEEQVALDILQLDVAQRLRDPKRIAPVYQRVLERGIDRMSIGTVPSFTYGFHFSSFAVCQRKSL